MPVRVPLFLTAVLAATAGSSAPLPSGTVLGPEPLVIHVTPTSIEPGVRPPAGQKSGKRTADPRKPATQQKTTQAGDEEQPKVRNPIAEALRAAKPGTTIWLDPGDYPPFTIGFQSHSPANAAISGGAPGSPIIIQGTGPGVRIVGVEGDTIAIDQRVPNGWITFRNLTIVPGQRAGVMFYERKDGKLHQGYSFEDCHILGAFDHETGKGKRTKWGIWGQNLADFRFVGVQAPARIENISEEHAFYLQNVQGAITIENVYARDLGRTFCQFTARARDGSPAKGDVIVRKCVVEDACIAQADGFKGGAAFTVCGRMQGAFLFEQNVYRAGFRKERLRFTRPGQPYGTGAFTAWEEGGAGQTATLVLRDNQFLFAKGCGDRPVVSIGGCNQVLIVGENRFVSGGVQPALSLDPADGTGKTFSTPNGSVYLAPATKVDGAVTVLGKVAGPELIDELAKLPAEPEPSGATPPGTDEGGSAPQ
jgi:hypothetical protein